MGRWVLSCRSAGSNKVPGRKGSDQHRHGLRLWPEEGALGTGRNLGPEEGVLGCRPRKWGGHRGLSAGN